MTSYLVLIRVKPETEIDEEQLREWVLEQFYGCDLGSVEVVKIEKDE